MAVYYVSTSGNDGNAGSLNFPWRTLGKAAPMLVAGDILYVRGGIYYERCAFWWGGSSTNKVTIAAYPGETPIIDGTGLSEPGTPKTIILGSNITFDGFTVRNNRPAVEVSTTTGDYNAIQAFQSNNVTVKNCIVHTCWGCGIHLHGDNNKVEDCVVYDVVRYKLYDTTGNAWPGAITIGHSMPGTFGFGSNSAVRRTKSYLNGGEGIMLMNCHTSVAEDNQVWDNRAVNIHLTDSDGCTVQRNVVYGTPESTAKWGGIGRGINLTNEYDNTNPSGSNNNKILNNIVYNVGEALSVWRYYPTSTTNCIVAYNTFVDSRLSGYGSGANMINFWGSGTASGNIFRNNIIDTVVAGATIFSGSTSGWTFDHNIWRLTPSGVTLDGNSIVSNPNLKRTGSVAAGSLDIEYFRPLSGSWCYDHAVAISGVPSDITGITRDAVTPSVGVFETVSGVGENVTWGSIPSPWGTVVIGSENISGNSFFANSQFRIDNTGNDIWGTTDEFRFVYQQVSTTGTFDIIARLASYTTTSSQYAKYGLMVRKSLTANSAHVFICKEPSDQASGYSRVYRREDAGNTTQSLLTQYSTDKWLRILKQGNTFFTYTSSDALAGSWTEKANVTLNLDTTAYAGLAVCSQNTSALATGIFDNVQILENSLPSPWLLQDVGPMGLTSNSSYSSGVISLGSNGIDVWNTGDSFYFCYTTLIGDGDIIVRVVSQTDTGTYAKAGLMMRNTLSANSEYFTVDINPYALYGGPRIESTKRSTFNGVAAEVITNSPNTNKWLKLSRINNIYYSSHSSNGIDWTPFGNTSIQMNTTIYIGLFTCSTNTSLKTYAAFDNFSISQQGARKMNKFILMGDIF